MVLKGVEFGVREGGAVCSLPWSLPCLCQRCLEIAVLGSGKQGRKRYTLNPKPLNPKL